ncbi:MAG: metal-dependent transcriptional regulator [Actinomycetota bacterium]
MRFPGEVDARHSKRAKAAGASVASGPEPSPSEEMYLKTLQRLEGEGRVTGAQLAEALGISAPSVSEMLHRLEKRGWVKPGSGGVHLSARGRRLAIRTIRRHRLAERLFTDVLRLPWEQVHEPACALEHAVSDAVADRIDEVLQHPSTCPHGHPIPSRDGGLPEETGRGLASLQTGGRGVVLRISREDPDLLSYLGTLGLVPGANVTVEQVAPFGGPLLVRVGRTRYALGREVAAMVAVREVLQDKAS